MKIADYKKYIPYLIIALLLIIISFMYLKRPINLSKDVEDQIVITNNYKKEIKTLDSLLFVSESKRQKLGDQNYILRLNSQKVLREKKELITTLDSLKSKRLSRKINYKPKDRTDEEVDKFLSDLISKYKY